MPLTSSHWGAYYADRRAPDGEALSIRPFERDPNPSGLIAGLSDYRSHAVRVRRPAVRESWLRQGAAASGGLRGAEPFVEVDWDTALDLVAGELRRVKTAHGNQAIFGGSYGWSSAGRFHHAKTQLKRFLNSFGGCVDQVNNYSFGAAMVLLPHIVGDNAMLFGPTTSWPSIVANTRLLVTFGGLPTRNGQIESGGCGEHIQPTWVRRFLAAGGRIVNIGPARGDMDAAAEWLPARPGSDTAILFALTHTLIAEGLVDDTFVARCTTGFDRFADYLCHGRDGEAFDADWQQGLSGLPADRLRHLARELAGCRSFLNLNWSLQRADAGEQTFWSAIALASALGQIGLPGGGVGFGYGSMNGTGNPVSGVRAPSLPTGRNPVGLSIPVARLTETLASPGIPLDYDGRTLTLPDIKLVYWAGGNPFHHHQDLNKLTQAWRRPQTVIVHEQVWTATARHADIVLPATMPLERDDIGGSSSDRFLIAMKKAAEPIGEARDDYAIFSGLAERLGIADAYTEGRDTREWLEHLYGIVRASARARGIAMPEFNAFWEAGHIEFPEAAEPYDAFAGFRADPEGRPLRTPSGRIEIVCETIDRFGYADCPGHPVWRPSREWLGAPLARRYPLHLLSVQPAHRLHGQLDPVGPSLRSKIDGREPIRLNPADAAARGIRAGDVVRVFNDRGACLAGTILDDGMMPGVVQMATGAWFDPAHPGKAGSLDVHGNPNVLTHDRPTSALSGGCAAQSCLVEIESFRAPLPPITVFSPPEIIPLDPAADSLRPADQA